jgi:8-oxo-dGTP pyrophosphatase MutT (NUDIX family)
LNQVIGFVRELDCIVATHSDYDWPYASEHAASIEASFARAKAAKPSLFNGRLFLSRSRTYENAGRRLNLEAFETDYAAYLDWRAEGFPEAEVFNFFSMAALQCADGAFLLAEMAEHTANAGRIYFPSGAPDRKDLVEGRVDLGLSALRELGEETGLSPADVRISQGWVAIEDGPRLACMKPMLLNMPADEGKRRIEDFLAHDPEPELARIHVVRTLDDLAALNASPFAALYIRFAWASRP